MKKYTFTLRASLNGKPERRIRKIVRGEQLHIRRGNRLVMKLRFDTKEECDNMSRYVCRFAEDKGYKFTKK